MTENDSADDERLMDEVEAMALWERHLSQANERWKEGVSRSADDYREGLAEAMGVEPSDVPDGAVEHWQESVMNTDAEQFASAMTGEGADWFTGLYERMTGEEPPPEVRDLAREVEEEALSNAGEDASDEEIVDAVRDAVERRRSESAGA